MTPFSRYSLTRLPSKTFSSIRSKYVRYRGNESSYSRRELVYNQEQGRIHDFQINGAQMVMCKQRTSRARSPKSITSGVQSPFIPLSHLCRRSAGDRCALSDVDKFHQSALKSPKNVKSTTSGSFIVAHNMLLTRSHCDHLRSECDSSTLSTQSYCALYALSVSKSPSLRFHYVLSAFTTCVLRLRYAYIEHSAISSVYVLLSAAVCAPKQK